LRKFFLLALATMALAIIPGVASAAPRTDPLPGAIFTTDIGCTGVDLNSYSSKDDVYLDGGPKHPGAASMPDGSYYVKVESPQGTLLGTSLGAANETPFVVVGGEPADCYQLSDILVKASDNSVKGYDDTENAGSEYKVTVSTVATFDNAAAKTDNFKVKDNGGEEQHHSTLSVDKYYDVNGNGTQDAGDPAIPNWRVHVTDSFGFDDVHYTKYTTALMDAGVYTVSEDQSVINSWVNSTLTSFNVTLVLDQTTDVLFGNYCRFQGVGARTIGYFKTHQTATTALLPVTLYPGVTVSTWSQALALLSGASAQDANVMLKAQLLGAVLNVKADPTFGTAYIAGTGKTVNQVIADAQAYLAVNGATVLKQDSALRTEALALKTQLDGINNSNEGGSTFVINPTPCEFDFAPLAAPVA
jgi:hypothetical protein